MSGTPGAPRGRSRVPDANTTVNRFHHRPSGRTPPTDQARGPGGPAPAPAAGSTPTRRCPRGGSLLGLGVAVGVLGLLGPLGPAWAAGSPGDASAARSAVTATAKATAKATSGVAGGGSPATAPATYRTRIPPPAELHYALSRGVLRGEGELRWQPDATGYTLRLEGKLPPFGTLITQTSTGRFDAAGLAPLRHTDKRVRRDERSATFDREQGTIRFSGRDATAPLQPGTQDRLSVMVQLAAIAEAWTQPPPAGTVFEMEVVGARGDAHRWALRYEGEQAVTTAQGTTQALKFERAAEGGKDTRAEFWLDPQAHHLPVRARLTDGDGDALELLRTPR